MFLYTKYPMIGSQSAKSAYLLFYTSLHILIYIFVLLSFINKELIICIITTYPISHANVPPVFVEWFAWFRSHFCQGIVHWPCPGVRQPDDENNRHSSSAWKKPLFLGDMKGILLLGVVVQGPSSSDIAEIFFIFYIHICIFMHI